MTKVYKVVYHTNTKKLSFWALLCPELCVEYKKNVPATAPVGKLFAFDTLKHAQQHKEGVYGKEIWEAEATNVRLLSKNKIFCTDDRILLKIAKYFWWRKLTKDKLHSLCEGASAETIPPGTVTCSTITLLRKVA